MSRRPSARERPARSAAARVPGASTPTAPAPPAPAARSPLVDREETRVRILAVARECFVRQGTDATTMADVAERSGTSRQMLYRFFSGREELVEAAIVARIGELAEGLTAARDAERTFERALVETSVATIEVARSDGELQALLAAAPSMRLHQILAGPYPPVVSLVRRFWQPWFDRARRTGHLRTDVSDDELVEWIRGVYLMLILRDDLRGDVDRERLMLRRFLVPALVPAR